MTTRRIQETEEEVTNQDAFGTPPAARGSMLNIAGKDDADEELPLLDDGDDTTMKGPVYEGGRTLRISVRELRKLVVASLQ